MTNEEILKKAIEKAVKNGYAPFNDPGDNNAKFISYCFFKDYMVNWDFFTMLVFSHDFAKAFWGDKPTHIENIEPIKDTEITWRDIEGTTVSDYINQKISKLQEELK